MNRKLLAMLLLAAMLVSLFPMSAFADDADTAEEVAVIEETIEEAIPEVTIEESVSEEPGEEANSEEPTEDETAAAVTVIIRCNPEEAELTLRTFEGEDEILPEDGGTFILTPGAYSLTASCEGYLTLEESLYITGLEDGSVIDVCLEKLEADIEENEMAVASSGKCGADVTWTLEDGLLTISGTGDMYNDYRPWYSYSTCATITRIVVEDGVTSIGDEAFDNLYNVTSVTIPNSVTSIGKYAFYFCKSLTCIDIPSNVTFIGEKAFYGCSKITSITIPASETFLNCQSLESIDIAESVTAIEYEALAYCYSLKSIKLPSNLTTIGENAFFGSNGFSSIVIPATVISIGKCAFRSRREYRT